jgi:hypothetical protein
MKATFFLAKLFLFLSASFFGLFEATLSTSVTTGYNWATTSEAAKSEQVTFQIKTYKF